MPKRTEDIVVFANLSSAFVADNVGVVSVADIGRESVVVVKEGEVLCWGVVAACSNFIVDNVQWIDLEGGSISCVMNNIQITCLFNLTHPVLALSRMVPHLDWKKFRARGPRMTVLFSTLSLTLFQAFSQGVS